MYRCSKISPSFVGHYEYKLGFGGPAEVRGEDPSSDCAYGKNRILPCTLLLPFPSFLARFLFFCDVVEDRRYSAWSAVQPVSLQADNITKGL
jgi:hypothetical protein